MVHRCSIYYEKNINYDSEEKKVAKCLHARGLEPETFRAKDAHATNRLCMGYGHSCLNSSIYGAPQQLVFGFRHSSK